MAKKAIVNVDFTSLYGIAQSLTTRDPSNWALDSYYTITSALLELDDVRVPPPREAAQTYRLMIRPIQMRFGTHTRLRKEDNEEASRYSQDIDENRKSTIRQRLALWWSNTDYTRWLQWHVDKEWRDHIKNLHGLIEGANIPRTAEILGKPAYELTEANREAERDADKVCSNPSDLQKKMYTVDVALRGLYYDKLAALTKRGVILHPIRRAILDAGGRKVSYPTPVTPYLVAIIGNWACAQRLADEYKVASWTDLLLKCRDSYRDWRRHVLGQQIADPKAIATDIAKKAGITNPLRLRNGWKEAFEIGTGLAAGIVVEVILQERGVPETQRAQLREMAATGASLVADFGLKTILETFEESPWAISRLSDKSGWFGRRMFSYKEAVIAA